MIRRHDITGQKFGLLTAKELHSVRNGKAYWTCKCDCGGTKTTEIVRLRNGTATSCGCKRRSLMTGNKIPLTHGHASNGTQTPEYRAWAAMISRCHSPTSRAAKWYHDRGITVCDRWRNSFEAFLADMGPRPSPELSIDRIDNDGNYEPGNCRWTTTAVQMQNRRPRSPKPTHAEA